MFSFQGAFWVSSSRNSMKLQISLELQSIPWWRVPGSNRWPPACKAGALPAELTPHVVEIKPTLVAFPSFRSKCLPVALFLLFHSNPLRWALNGALGFIKLKWWAKMDSNHRPHDYQSCALASWAIGPSCLHFSMCFHTFGLCPLNWIT